MTANERVHGAKLVFGLPFRHLPRLQLIAGRCCSGDNTGIVDAVSRLRGIMVHDDMQVMLVCLL